MKHPKLILKTWLLPSVLIGLLLIIMIPAGAQEDTRPIGTIRGEHTGYTLFTPQGSDRVYLIDDQGRLIHDWTVEDGGRDAILRENGNIVVSMPRQNPPEENFAQQAGFADADGAFAEYTWDGEQVWFYEFDRPDYKVHHGISVLPNGNIMFIAWHRISVEEAIANGRDPELLGDSLWSDVILEYSPTEDAIVWEWHAWDHLIQDFDPEQANYGDVAANPQLIDINFFQDYQWIEDWHHANALDYNPELEQVAISVREFNEIWIIDHSISTEAATGPAGDLLYRWGNPRSYRMGDESDRQMSFQHDVRWVPPGYPGEGNITVYSNRHSLDPEAEDDADNYSKVVEFTPPLLPDGTYAREEGQAFGPEEPVWTYDGIPNRTFYSRFISGARRLANGNTLITAGQQRRLFEVTPFGVVTWDYRVPMRGEQLATIGQDTSGGVFRINRYEPDFPAFEGRDLTPGATLEELAGTSLDFLGSIGSNEAAIGTFTAETSTYYFLLVLDHIEVIDIQVALDDSSANDSISMTMTNDSEEIIGEDSGIAVASIEGYRGIGSQQYLLTLEIETIQDDASIPFTLSVERQESILDDIAEDIPILFYGTVIPYDAITEDDEESLYAFWANAGDTVGLSVNLLDGNLSPVIELRNIEGDLVATASEISEDGQIIIDNLVISDDNIYIVRVGRNVDVDDSTNNIGSFEFELLDMSTAG